MPAEPLLASSLLGDGELEALWDEVVGGQKGMNRRDRVARLVTGVKKVDEALGGGFEKGRVVGVSSDTGGGSVDLCLTLLANSLLQDPNSTAAIIDTTGNVDIMRLYTFILSSLQSDTALLGILRTNHASADPSVEDVAAKVLDRVKIMRVFDLVGVVEAVGEIRDGLEGKWGRETTEVGETKATEQNQTEGPRPKKTVIADSEDEDEEEDEMLFETEDAPRVTPKSDPIPEQDLLKAPCEAYPENEDRISFTLIDNLAHVINPLLKKDYIQTHAFSSSFLLTLSNLTRIHRLHTLLLNPSTVPRPAPPNSAQTGANQTAPPQQQKYQPPPPSIFASIKDVPALASVWSPFLDLHLLVEQMPRRQVDARVLYADGGTLGRVRARQDVEMVSVVEVLADRWDGRVGAWGQFLVDDQRIKDM
ncbi:hypothetical protein K458DRAFT_322730 [Lentithecium fluviatile CBS 122367]|uniref:Uncharacterized protein n=1 Tax=Lentithecium fluviatile CBS 122367 TaxID=1168545 RepID=A0A6G1IDU1_9PLEO|nr:hypothetical protein K458DRAFT_322730 [Lentithecium fluviatile CBS 122367]